MPTTPPMFHKLEQFTRSTEYEYSIEASTLQWAPGHYAASILIKDGTKWINAKYDRTVRAPSGETLMWSYTTDRFTITVFND